MITRKTWRKYRTDGYVIYLTEYVGFYLFGFIPLYYRSKESNIAP